MRTNRDWKLVGYGGVVAGLVAGVVDWVVLALGSAAQGQNVWTTFKVAGFPFLGERALAPGFDGGAIAIGTLCHFLVSAGWGALFGVVFFGAGKAFTVFAGALYGILVWLGMFYVVLPLVGASQIAAGAPLGMAVMTHVIFGATLGFAFLPFQRPSPRPISAEIKAT